MTELQQATEAYLAAKEAHEAAEAEEKRCKKATEDAERRMIDALKEAGLESCRDANGVTFTAVRKYYYREASAATRAQLLDVLEKDGYRGLFSVQHTTLNSLMNEIVENNEGAIPDRYRPYITEYDKPKLSVTGRKRAGRE